MNILFLTDGIYPFVNGGMQKHSYNLSRHLARLGVNITLVHPGFVGLSHNVKPLEHYFSSVELKSIELIEISFPNPPKFPGHYLYASFLYSKRIFKAVRYELSNYDVVYVQGFSGWELLRQVKNYVGNPSIVINFHGFEMFQRSASLKSWFQNQLLKPFIRHNIQFADKVVSLGSGLTNLIEQKVGVPKERIIVNPNGINSTWFIRENEIDSSEKNLKFLFIGRNERRKGVAELLQAFKNIRSNFKETTLQLVGDFTEIELNTDSGVIIHGVIMDEQELIKIIDNCDVLICPSYSEGMPTVILEAMSRGLAILATDVGAVVTMVDESNGCLLDSPDVNLIVRAMEHFITMEKSKLFRFKTKSLEKAKEFSWENVAKLNLNELQRITCARV